MPHHPDAPAQEQSVGAIADELERAKEASARKDRLMSQAVTWDTKAKSSREVITDGERQIAALTQKIKFAREQEVQAHDESATLKNQAAQVVIPDIGAIRQRLDAADGINKMVRDNLRHKTESGKLKQAESAHTALEKKIETLRGKRDKMILDAKFPVVGLGVTENGVTYQDIPFSQASQAEQLRVSVAMGLAMNPTLKLLLIRDGSLLDDANLAEVARMADEAGAQILMERVGKDARTSIVIEDGMVEVEP
jgi:hypothetical protein